MKKINLDKIYLPSPKKPLEKENLHALDLKPKLLDILKQGKNIKRHKNPLYPKNLVTDNVYNHTLRCVEVANLLGTNKKISKDTVLTINLHDIPEIAVLINKGIDHDLTAPEKRTNPDLADEIEEAEEQMAKNIFTKKELELYQQYNLSKTVLFSTTKIKTLSPAGLLAKIIDGLDGNIVFHSFTTKWTLSRNYDPKYNFPNKSLTYTFEVYKTVQKNIDTLDTSNSIKQEAKTLFYSHVEFVKSLWQKVPSKKIPFKLKKYL